MTTISFRQVCSILFTKLLVKVTKSYTITFMSIMM